MSEIEEIDNQIKVLQMKRKILKDAEEAKKAQPFVDRLGKEVYDFLNTFKGFGEGKMKILCAMKNVTPDTLKKAFPLLGKLNDHDIGIIVTAVNRPNSSS